MLTWNVGKLSDPGIFDVVDHKESEICRQHHQSSAHRTGKCLGVNDFGVFCFLAHVERIGKRAKHVVERNHSIILDA